MPRQFQGIDVDVCRAVAAAVFGDATKVKYSPLTAKERSPRCSRGSGCAVAQYHLDQLAGRRDGAELHRRDLLRRTGLPCEQGAWGVLGQELDGATVHPGRHHHGAEPVRLFPRHVHPITTTPRTKAPIAGIRTLRRADLDQSQLYAQRIKLAKPDDYVVLPEVISKEPLGPAVRQGDEEWFDIVRWTLFAMLNAEELGVTSANVEEMAKSTKNPDVARLLGAEGEYGKDLRLPKDWAVQIVKQVGNYGEIFDRNVGAGSELKIERGLNALWNKGGLQHAPPVR